VIAVWRRAMASTGLAGRSLEHQPLESPREREAAGRIGSSLFVLGGVAIWTLSAFSTWDAVAMAALGALTFLSGVAMLLFIPWPRAPRWVYLVFTLYGIGLLAGATALTDGVDSPALLMSAAIIAFAGAFLRPLVALACVALVALVTVLPVVYDDDLTTNDATEILVTAPFQLVLGIAVILGAVRIRELAGSQQRLARQQTALLGLAKDVASDREGDDDVFTRAAREAAELLAADGGLLMRVTAEGDALVVAEWRRGREGIDVGTILPAGPGTPGGRVRETAQPILFDTSDPGALPEAARELPFDQVAIAPVRALGEVWGLIAVATGTGNRLPGDAPERLAAFAELIGTTVVNREAREQLVERASRDPLTGLLNHRSFHECLRTELARAQRYGRELALVVLDVDHFKSINDAAGHDIGDDVLAAIASRLQQAARTEDTIARIGGDEFAMLLPESDGVRAFAAIERARALIGATPLLPGVSVTVSAGICDTRHAQDADTMFRLADGALYWSKAHGRDASWIYDPEIVHELSAAERAEQLRRSQALLGIRALARAIDAKDPSTRRHSERVAALSRRLAETLDWDPARAALLEEAALVHDVGKIGVPDAVLLKPGRLTTTERTLVGRHAELGAQIVEDVLTEEQVEWIHAHHERPDGQGYPRGLSGAQISMGAAILTVADSFDVMTMHRPYSAAKPTDEALAECEGLVGRQFLAEPVGALARLHASGELTALMEAREDDPGPLDADPVDMPPQT
jgi:diguanylate cyclase (GGDEF)-like protein/putative nucleotidyltransferase with HDIG domain